MTSHNRTPSPASTLTDLSDSVGDLAASVQSISSITSSVSVTSDDFKLKIDALISSDTLKIEHLESRARAFITDLKDDGRYNTPLYGDKQFREQVKLHRILEAMLDVAYDCGKENGKRYAACAICACSVGDGNIILDGNADQNVIKLAYLQELSTTWLSHLLFVFKANSSHGLQQNPTPSTIATPTLNETAGHLDEGAKKNRPSHFRNNVLVRDGYRCAVTGRYDAEHPQVPEDQEGEQVELEASHILRRAIAVFKGADDKSDEYLSALTTFDILRNYADLPIKSIEDIAQVIDTPSNGIALQADAHKGFDKFKWSLKETENPNEYTTVIFEKKAHGISKSGDGKTVIFTDHSREFNEPSSPPRKKLRSAGKGFDLPNPLFIRIHCAIARILHMSGAGKLIDQALDRTGERGTSVLTGADFAYFGLAEDLEGAISQMAAR